VETLPTGSSKEATSVIAVYALGSNTGRGVHLTGPWVPIVFIVVVVVLLVIWVLKRR